MIKENENDIKLGV